MIQAAILLASALCPLPQDPGGFDQPGMPANSQPGTQTISRLVAIVNDQVLTSLRVERLAFSIAKQRKDAGQEITNQEYLIIRSQAFSGLLLDMLFREGFRMEGLDPAMLDRIVASQIDQGIDKAGSMAAFNRKLALEGKSMEAYTQELRALYTSVIFMRMEAGMMPSKGGGRKASVWVGPQEVRKYYQDNIDDFRREFRVAARMILIREQAGEDLARIRLSNLRAEIRSGGVGFADAARENSDYRASVGGSLGWVNPETSNLQKPILEFLSKAAPGEISEPIQVTGGWVLGLAEEVRPAGLVPFEEVQVELTAKLLQKHQNALMREVVNRLRTRCYLWGDEVDLVLDNAYKQPGEGEEAF